MSRKALVLSTLFLLLGAFCANATFAAVAVNIINPATGSEFLEGSTVFLQGEGTVTETNFPLSGNDLQWFANNVSIGGGNFISWRPSPGSYRITLIGDIENMQGVDEIQITVIASNALTVTVTIANPPSGSEFLEGDTISLEGTGQVQETNSPLSGNQLNWFANNVPIGQGQFLAWTPQAGVYRVTLRGNAQESTGVAEIQIRVLSPEDLTVTLNITSPTSGTTFRLGETVIFIGEGQVTQTEESLKDEDLVWVSNIDGTIGNGRFLTKDDLSVGTHTIYLIGRQRAIRSIEITIASSSLFFREPIQSGDVAMYNWATNTLYVPLLDSGVTYWVNLAVTAFTTPLTFEVIGLGLADFSPSARYADFNFLTNSLRVPVFLDRGVSFWLTFKLLTFEAPFTFELTGAGLNAQ